MEPKVGFVLGGTRGVDRALAAALVLRWGAGSLSTRPRAMRLAARG